VLTQSYGDAVSLTLEKAERSTKDGSIGDHDDVHRAPERWTTDDWHTFGCAGCGFVLTCM